MATIINIDTSSSICSVSLSKDGEILKGFESQIKMDHASSLAPFVNQCLDFLRSQGEKPDAVSVVYGPGSYTGLRIGLSMAKGLAFGFTIPMIVLSSLEVMAVRAIFSYPDIEGDEIIVPMLDARRMEVYTGVLSSTLHKITPEGALILDSSSFADLKNERKVIFCGDGCYKFKDLYSGENGVFLNNIMPHAKYMPVLSEKYYKERNFSDVAYTVPNYLKEYQTTIPKNPFKNIEKNSCQN